ncbi:thiopurine S-methyltransferase isoform X2 [Callorhinchus milii]|uniref:thiopurine S-methyltransferase n=2 Tax=Callorhinchus milii TaxID=7868 RepID=K4FSU0_CALMI|nr:thiopurine S-methyltransferase [Callorhinchus milii]XP_042201713.1 thiopurine S-methyltransferase isoform X2 [Callorhinchus milii]XP_042201714.1 thiopurine S-methyltransferase isoform X2 [Callorhinchus milii]XP_042201715.1 thiopurine S-methyltransferase isoform X2 [Callorhinchus milii]XP_042201716.1 thiopurine S-methyltransferase isoform X2 [Callorhinchus milii]XP_042201717.1 thiopurine S-methyltransferase isoform X2 [Callorhinchus milii]XP_042201719.1 thiopurine S-methyltransferase isofor|eukprot:gi/632969891/ref/XP_007901340.1/ PREDICTED: thiopurine S-methyltransferase [Callorhinchus milii]
MNPEGKIPAAQKLNRYGEIENIEMTPEDWLNRWKKRQIGFHENKINEKLNKHLTSLINGRKKIRIFFPLCGKAIDMKWLADLGHTIVGVEVSELGIKEFFEEQDLSYTRGPVPEVPGAEVFKSDDGEISLFKCSLFDFTSSIAGQFDGIWDRGSLVAINPSDRQRYATVLISLMGKGCHYLLDTLVYGESNFIGTPHCVPEHTIQDLYGQTCNIQLLESSDALTDKQRSWGLNSFIENVHLIMLKTDFS